MMKNINFINIGKFLIFLILVFFLFSCKKNVDETKPTISILSPKHNTNIDVSDTIIITGNISDNEIITSIQINIVDENYVSQSATKTINPNSNEYDLNVNYVISNQYLSSGKYYLLIKASDGVNESKSFTSLYISENPRIKEGLIIFSHTDDNSTNVYKISDSLGNELILTMQNAMADATISSFNKQIYLTGKTNESISAYDLGTGDLVWQESNLYSFLTETYTGTTKMIENYVFVAKSKNSIIGLDKTGTIRKIFYINEDYLSPQNFFRFDDFVAITTYGVGGAHKFGTSNFTSGASLTTIYSNFNVDNVIDKNDDLLFLIGNKDDTLLIKSYSKYYNITDEIISLPQTNYHSSIKIEDNSAYIIANNSLYEFNFIYSTMSEVLSGIDATNIIYDDLNNEIIMYSENTIYTYSFPDFNLIDQIFFSETIDKVEILYNK